MGGGGTNEEDNGDDRLTSGPSAPVCDGNEMKKRDEMKRRYVNSVFVCKERKRAGKGS